MIMLLPIALVLCAYFWSGSPQVLKKNKELLLGILFGYSICYFMDNKLVEGLSCESDSGCPAGEKCIFREGLTPPMYGECGITNQRTCNDNQPCPVSEECIKVTKGRHPMGWVCKDPPHGDHH